ncbi:MAG: GFA family protein [Bradyrhizobium sp.]|uniref:GFA family protein n=1 Tax=Bradyrhizobium sp. TaxID=376 RepID=UPI0025BB9AC4|nr:GFA family protein [Bradyrhizobium sp.]MBI5261350.1 GFA family protein [Bradyrhizobium sp.]
MKIDGRCHCGIITFEAEVDPAAVVICHCTDCQTLSGSAFRTVVPTREGSFRLLSGTPKVYVKTGESGNKREQTFCPNCGTPIYSGPIGNGAKVVSLRVGTIRQRDQMVPSDQYWFRSAQAWLSALPTIKRRETQPVFDPKGGFGR